MTSSIDSTGVLVYIKGTTGMHGNTGEPPVSTGIKVQYGNTLPKISKLVQVYTLTRTDAKDKGVSEVVSVPRETEGKEKDKGSLSISIVPIESWKICPRKASE